jgi:UDP-N-acetylmuramate--alanine ligase
VIDDYGHHPVEIAAVLKAARQAGARDVIAVVQPHRYSRLQQLFTEFCTCMNDAGTVIVADVYAAGEAPIEGMDKDGLVDGPARPRPPQRGAAARARQPGRDGERHRQAGRLRGVPGRGQHHRLGACLPEQLAGLQAQGKGPRVAPLRRA